MTRTFTNVALLGSIATLFSTGPAWAYLDPGTGSMMLQLLLGGIAGAMIVGRLYWHRFREFVTSRFSAKPGKITQAGHVSASARTNAPDE